MKFKLGGSGWWKGGWEGGMQAGKVVVVVGVGMDSGETLYSPNLFFLSGWGTGFLGLH